MDYHQNARLTVYSRELLAKRVLEQGLTLMRRGPLQSHREDGSQVGQAIPRRGRGWACGSQFASRRLHLPTTPEARAPRNMLAGNVTSNIVSREIFQLTHTCNDDLIAPLINPATLSCGRLGPLSSYC
jgi:hypothetical protein